MGAFFFSAFSLCRGAGGTPGFPARGRGPLCTPQVGAFAPTAPNVGAQLPLPQRAGAPPRAPGDFRFTTKVTKGVPGLRPWTPLGGHYHPPSSARMYALAAPPRKGLSLQPRPICHFEMGGRIGLFFSPRLAEVTPSGFRPWRGRAGRLGGWNKSLEQWPFKLFSLYTLYKTFLLNRERIIVPEKVADS